MKSLLKKFTFPFFETIRIENGVPCLLKYHQRRVNHVFRYFYPSASVLNLENIILSNVDRQQSILKFRIEYNACDFSFNVAPYTPRSIDRLICMESAISYPFKFSDRSVYQSLTSAIKTTEEILLVRQGRLLETSYSNVLFRVNDRWLTPLYPLFYGVMRTHLLTTGQIETSDLFVRDLVKCDVVKLINAMMPMTSCITLPVKSIDLSQIIPIKP